MKKVSKSLFNDLFEVPVFCVLATLAIIGFGFTLLLIYIHDLTGCKILPLQPGSDKLLIGAGVTCAIVGFMQSIIASCFFYCGFNALGFDIIIYPSVIAALFLFFYHWAKEL